MTPSEVDGPARVRFVEMELTRECEPPSRRYHARTGVAHSAAEMTTASWEEVIASAADSGVELIRFTGNQSALFPGLVEYALSTGVRVDVHSPLVHVSDAMWELFALPEVSLGICWYVADPLEHTDITGTVGSWYQARQNTVRALERGLSPRAEVVMLCDGRCITHARAELKRLGLAMISTDYARSAFLGAEERPPRLEDLCVGCGDGRAGVTWSGTVVPCVVLGRHLSAGNVTKTSFADIITGPRWAHIRASIPRDRACRVCVDADALECVQEQS